METHEIEAWGLRVIDALAAGAPVEDSVVELKADWTDPNSTARRIGGLCNAAKAATVLLIIGVDEKTRMVTGINTADFSAWWAKVKAEFDGPVPEIAEVATRHSGMGVMLISCDTSRRPFVVKNTVHGQKGGGPVCREVPWRDGTAVQSARHEDLVRLLSPTTKSPLTDLIYVNVDSRPLQDDFAKRNVKVSARFYIVPRTENFVIPFYRCVAAIRQHPEVPWIERRPTILKVYEYRTQAYTSITAKGMMRTTVIPEQQIEVSGPCTLSTDFTIAGCEVSLDPNAPIEFILSFNPLEFDDAINIRCDVPSKSATVVHAMEWGYVRPHVPQLPG